MGIVFTSEKGLAMLPPFRTMNLLRASGDRVKCLKWNAMFDVILQKIRSRDGVADVLSSLSVMDARSTGSRGLKFAGYAMR